MWCELNVFQKLTAHLFFYFLQIHTIKVGNRNRLYWWTFFLSFKALSFSAQGRRKKVKEEEKSEERQVYDVMWKICLPNAGSVVLLLPPGPHLLPPTFSLSPPLPQTPVPKVHQSKVVVLIPNCVLVLNQLTVSTHNFPAGPFTDKSGVVFSLRKWQKGYRIGLDPQGAEGQAMQSVTVFTIRKSCRPDKTAMVKLQVTYLQRKLWSNILGIQCFNHNHCLARNVHVNPPSQLHKMPHSAITKSSS